MRLEAASQLLMELYPQIFLACHRRHVRDDAGNKLLSSHQVIRQRGLRVLENLMLDDVPEGDYELIALPLKLTTACASPVRAVLREMKREMT